MLLFSTIDDMKLLLEFIDYYVKRNTRIFVTFPDASKAFDRVNYWMLFLVEENVALFIVKLLVFWYAKTGNESMTMK